jgi:hypothetical protein
MMFMRPSLLELQEFWLFNFARYSLKEADEVVGVMNGTLSEIQWRSLSAAATIAYARPFRQCRLAEKKRVVPLEGIAPPRDLATDHNAILTIRDQAIGHKDAILADEDVTMVNTVVFTIDGAGLTTRTIGRGLMVPGMIPKIQTLCSHFVSHCDSRLGHFLEKYGHEIHQRPAGKYDLVLTDPPAEWIRARPPSARPAWVPGI